MYLYYKQKNQIKIMKLVVRLAPFILFAWSQAGCATIEEVTLVGDSNDYIAVGSAVSYSLRCRIRAGYDDPVRTVKWFKDGRLVYSWTEGSSVSNAFGDLVGKVETARSGAELGDIGFGRVRDFGVSGNYTCQVISAKETATSEPFPLVVLDVPSDDFQSNVTLVTEPNWEGEPDAGESGGQNCVLLWDFHTPAIYPKPNVTCGFYSYLHDDVTSAVPAGLAMHLLGNGSWQAKFDHVPMQVAEIPRSSRLGCSVSVPFTSYKRIIKFEDNFAIDHIIDARGCPSPFMDPMYGLSVFIDGGQPSCRGDLTPSSDGVPIVVKIRCLEDQVAMFVNGTANFSWSMEIVCDADFTWKIAEGDSSLDFDNDLPICVTSCADTLYLNLLSVHLFMLIASERLR